VATRPRVAESSPISAPARGAVGRQPWRGEDERALRRLLGPTAWSVLADLRLDAGPDDAGSQVVSTSARRVAAHLGIGKDAAARALARLSAVGLLHRRPQGADHAGRFMSGIYELRQAPTVGNTPCPVSVDTVGVACPEPVDAESDTVPASTTTTTVVAGTPSPRRRIRATTGSIGGQLSLLDSTPIDDAGHTGTSS
jgi:cell division septation protein DedD